MLKIIECIYKYKVNMKNLNNRYELLLTKLWGYTSLRIEAKTFSFMRKGSLLYAAAFRFIVGCWFFSDIQSFMQREPDEILQEWA